MGLKKVKFQLEGFTAYQISFLFILILAFVKFYLDYGVLIRVHDLNEGVVCIL